MLSDNDLNLLAEDVYSFSFRGEYKNLFSYFTTDNFQEYENGTHSEKRLITDMNRLRLSPEYKKNQNILIHGDIDNEIIIANYTESGTFDQFWHPSDYNALFDSAFESSMSGDAVYRLDLHRLYAKIVFGKLTTTLGRQQIRFGSGRLWNPLDILNPIEPTFFEGAEDQSGTDALRLEYYQGVSTEIALVYAPKREADNLDFGVFANRNTNLIARIRTTLRDADLAVLGGRVARRNLCGADIAAILWDGMLRGSLVYASPDDGAAYFLGSIGYEYNFSNGIYWLIEYFYNQNALNHHDALYAAYLDTSNSSGMNEEAYALTANQFVTFNRHYLGMVLGYEITPLLRGEIFSIADIDGKGIFLSPSLKYNLLQNLDLSITAMVGHIFGGTDYSSDFQDFEDHPVVLATLQCYF